MSESHWSVLVIDMMKKIMTGKKVCVGIYIQNAIIYVHNFLKNMLKLKQNKQQIMPGTVII